MKVLFLFESILPFEFHSGTNSPGELRVIAALPQVKTVTALGRNGKSFYDVPTHDITKSAIEKKISLHHLSWPKGGMSYYFCWIGLCWYGYRLLRKTKYDVIHAESPHISEIAALILGKLFHVRVIVEYRVNYDQLLFRRYGKLLGIIFGELFWGLSSIIMKSADFVMANSKTHEELLRYKLNIHTIGYYNPGVIVPNNFQQNAFTGKTIGFIGRLYKDKGPIYFLKMINIGKTWFRENEIHFLLAGEGPESAVLCKYIYLNQLSDLVTMLGTVDRWTFFKQIDVHINCTVVHSALEMTNAEAGLVGIPTIAFGDEKCPETVVSGITGEIVETGDYRKLKESLCVLIKDEKMYQTYSKNARNYSLKYSYENQILLMKQTYSHLI